MGEGQAPHLRCYLHLSRSDSLSLKSLCWALNSLPVLSSQSWGLPLLPPTLAWDPLGLGRGAVCPDQELWFTGPCPEGRQGESAVQGLRLQLGADKVHWGGGVMAKCSGKGSY